ncbi:hypothetical protein ABXT06_15175 [Flavobacterium sp. UW10123]|uniref:hypothetical protein n=1 Tax=Flavobacterium sp. UW10123 TaxID=3230800 RepID=UPI00339A75C4
MYTLKNPKIGDLFYTQIGKKFFFMQIIHITTNLPEPYDESQFKYGYFIVVFEKSFFKLPKSIEELDLNKIYNVKYKPKDTILYVSHWNEFPEIKIKNGRIDAEKYKKYELLYFGNTNVTSKFEPEIIRDFTMPAQCKYDDNGTQISHSPDDLNWIYSILIQDEEKQHEKKKKIATKHFHEWIEFVEADAIIKTEKILCTFELECKTKNICTSLKKSIVAINRLNEKLNFITTIEAENLFDKLLSLSKELGLDDFKANEIIENNRDW